MVKWSAIIVTLIILMVIPCRALEQSTVKEFAYSYDISKESIAFCDTDNCSGHVYFEQFSVNRNQWFAVYYRYTEAGKESRSAFGRAYIDIYNAEGVFQKEISFDTTQEIAIEMTDSELLVYFQSHVMAYTWKDNMICGYQIADYESVRADIFDNLRKAELTVGEWTYTSKAALHGYTELTRENGNTMQTLVALSGTGFTIWNTMFPGLLIGVATITITIAISFSKFAKQNKKG